MNCANDNITSLGFYVTKKCGQHCQYCLLDTVPGSEPDQMDVKTAIQAAQLFFDPQAESLEIEFFGGEPLNCISLLRDIYREITELFPDKIKVNLWTNAMGLTRRCWELIREWDVTLFVNGYLEEQESYHEKQPNQLLALFDTRGDGLHQALSEARSRIYLVWLVQSSAQDLVEIASAAQKAGFHNLMLLPERDKFNVIRWQPEDRQQILERYKDLLNWYSTEGREPEFKITFIEQALRSIRSNTPTSRCDFCHSCLAISPSGMISPCYTVIGESHHQIGHISVPDVIASSLNKVRLVDKHQHPVCEKCSALKMCGGVCIYEKLVADQNGLVLPSDCDLQKLIHEWCTDHAKS